MRRAIWLIFALGWAGVACGAPDTESTTEAPPYIEVQGAVGPGSHDLLTVLLNVQGAPGTKEWALKAAHYAISVYPRLVAQLPSPAFEAPKIVTIYFQEVQGVAYTQGRRITISALWIKTHPEDIGVVAHELTHVVQGYGHVDRDEAGWIVEGMADYMRYYVIETNSPKRHFNAARTSYKQGYQPAAGLLNWLEKKRGPGFVMKLNALLREGKYSEQGFENLAGGTPDEEWARFQASLGMVTTRPGGAAGPAGAATQANMR